MSDNIPDLNAILAKGPQSDLWKPFVEQTGIVRCHHCKRIHVASEDTFLAVHGNVTVGQYGGLIGNNLGPNGQVLHSTVFCMTPECVAAMFNCILFPVIRDFSFIKTCLTEVEKVAHRELDS